MCEADHVGRSQVIIALVNFFPVPKTTSAISAITARRYVIQFFFLIVLQDIPSSGTSLSHEIRCANRRTALVSRARGDHIPTESFTHSSIDSYPRPSHRQGTSSENYRGW